MARVVGPARAGKALRALRALRELQELLAHRHSSGHGGSADASSAIYRKLVEAMHNVAAADPGPAGPGLGGVADEHELSGVWGESDGDDNYVAMFGFALPPDEVRAPRVSFVRQASGSGGEPGLRFGDSVASLGATMERSMTSDGGGEGEGQGGAGDDDDDELLAEEMLRRVEDEVDAEFAGLDFDDTDFVTQLRQRQFRLAQRERELGRKRAAYHSHRADVEAKARRSVRRMAVDQVMHASVDYGPESVTGPNRKPWRFYAKNYDFPVSYPDVGSQRREYDAKKMRFKPIPLPWDHWDKKLKYVQDTYAESVKEEQRANESRWRGASGSKHGTRRRAAGKAKATAGGGDPVVGDGGGGGGGGGGGERLYELSTSERSEVSAIFNLFDSDHDGRISISELRSLIDDTVEQYPRLWELIRRVRYRRMRKQQRQEYLRERELAAEDPSDRSNHA
ncbi:uncharacterized protein AMSG_03442 [Thecamonas trahens ATCC 50062]|uniref:EF-hand domain-containing protein n=1 Tax=Thecamonas trahens ATCC 50062 TaxID=461836 RepID=A0A0L0D3X0_THETB|nr:hypothetical protein AMSG_03442 [Thecamonas trahens ATCC 50062]KNC47019.1 hypothetical protein AMSG_03442 [Thecamonas trahens ATCC 50062]|eukprot:XP_013759799.1 hypothetical protein AMSG_03442 [Thecamonas trahens ATCC 50062]